MAYRAPGPFQRLLTASALPTLPPTCRLAIAAPNRPTDPQLTREESVLDLSAASAAALHNRVRAFAGWPGTSATFLLLDEASGEGAAGGGGCRLRRCDTYEGVTAEARSM